MKSSFAFYQLLTISVEWALSKLLQKALDGTHPCVVRSDRAEKLEDLSKGLWEQQERTLFLPHAIESQEAPICLTADPKFKHKDSAFLFLIDNANPQGFENYARSFYIFDGRDDSALKQARDLWKAQTAEGTELVYYKQTDRGGWL